MSDEWAQPIRDEDAEKAVIGAMLASPEAVAIALEILTAEDFYGNRYEPVFKVIHWLTDDGRPVDPITVKAELEARKLLGEAGGPLTLSDAYAAFPTVANVAYYAHRVRETAVRRRIVDAGVRLHQLAHSPGLEVDERIDRARQLVDDATGLKVVSAGIPVAELVDPFLDRLESGTAEPALTTPFHDLTGLLRGLRPGQMVIVGGRPGAGKSTVMLQLAHHLGVHQQKSVLFVSLEMSRDELTARLIAMDAGVPLMRLQPDPREAEAELTEQDWRRIADARKRLADGRLVLSEEPGAGVGQIRATMRRMRRLGHPPELVAVDYLQLMTSPGRVESRQVEVSAMSRQLKLLAKEFGIPVVVGSQLNRLSELRADKTPLLADLRESGSLEQDADVVILVHRDDLHDKESPRSGEVDLIVAKHRNGPTATVTVAAQLHYARLWDMAPNPPASQGARS